MACTQPALGVWLNDAATPQFASIAARDIAINKAKGFAARSEWQQRTATSSSRPQQWDSSATSDSAAVQKARQLCSERLNVEKLCQAAQVDHYTQSGFDDDWWGLSPSDTSFAYTSTDGEQDAAWSNWTSWDVSGEIWQHWTPACGTWSSISPLSPSFGVGLSASNQPAYYEQEAHVDFGRSVSSTHDVHESALEKFEEWNERSEFGTKSYSLVPRRQNLAAQYGNTEHADSTPVTSLMIRNVPNCYNSEMLRKELDNMGFECRYDFVYLPIDNASGLNVGYAFVNFDDANATAKFLMAAEGYVFSQMQSNRRRTMQACPAHVQGLRNNLEHFRHKTVKPWIRQESLSALQSTWMPRELSIRSHAPVCHFQSSSALAVEPFWESMLPTCSAPVFVLNRTGHVSVALGQYLFESQAKRLLIVGSNASVAHGWKSLLRSQSFQMELRRRGAGDSLHFNPSLPNDAGVIIRGVQATSCATGGVSCETTDPGLRFLLRFSSSCCVAVPNSSPGSWGIELSSPRPDTMHNASPSWPSCQPVKSLDRKITARDVLGCILDRASPPAVLASPRWHLYIFRYRGRQDYLQSEQIHSRQKRPHCGQLEELPDHNPLHTGAQSMRTSVLANRGASSQVSAFLESSQSTEITIPYFWPTSLRCQHTSRHAYTHWDSFVGQPVSVKHRDVLKPTDLVAKYGSSESIAQDTITTLMVRNVPNCYTRGMLVLELDILGLNDTVDFLYLPIDHATQWNVGYAFVNFLSPADAARARSMLSGHKWTRFQNRFRGVASVSNAVIQGFENNVNFYSSSAVQRAKSESQKPFVFSHPGRSGLPCPSMSLDGKTYSNSAVKSDDALENDSETFDNGVYCRERLLLARPAVDVPKRWAIKTVSSQFIS